MPRVDQPRILLVEPDEFLAQVFSWALEVERWTASAVTTALAAVNSVRAAPPDLVVAEAALRDDDGGALADRLRGLRPGLPVLLLVPPDAPPDEPPPDRRTASLLRPFSLEQLTTTIRDELRRSGRAEGGGAQLRVADLVLDEAAHSVLRGGRQVRLSPTEFDLLSYLLRNRGRILPKGQILTRVWDYDYRGDPHVVETCVSSLRRKIDSDGEPLIRTVRGVGYVIGDLATRATAGPPGAALPPRGRREAASGERRATT